MAQEAHVAQTTLENGYRVDDLMIDVVRQRITRDRTEIPLSGLSFELLLVLTREAPRLVSLQTLMDRVWPGVVIGPETVSQRVKLVRDALGDHASSPRYIAGVRGRGYRLIASVAPLKAVTAADTQTASANDASVAAPAPITRGGPWDWVRKLKERRATVAVTALLALVAVVAVLVQVLNLPVTVSQRAALSKTVTVVPPRTVAVLPFQNLSTDPKDEFIALGIAESVLHRLASVRDLIVIARTSSFAYRNRSEDVREVGRKLNARYLVEGSVQRVSTRLRVTARLIDTSNGGRLWSIRLDRDIQDIFAVEDEISQSVARELQASLAGRRNAFAGYDTEAYLAYLQGRALIASRKEADADLAIQHFARAVELAPGSASALASLAEAYMHRARLTGYRLTGIEEREQAARLYATAEPLLTQALQLDRSLGEVYMLRGSLKIQRADLEGGKADYEKGLALSPNYGPGLELYAHDLHSVFGRDEEALLLLDRARHVDPLTPRNHDLKGVIVLTSGGSLEEAESLFLQALQVAPNFHPSLMKLAWIRASFMGRFAEGVKYGEQALAIDPRASWLREHLVRFYLDLGEPDAARDVLTGSQDVSPLAWVPVCVYENNMRRTRDLVSGISMDDLQPAPVAMVIRSVRDLAVASGDFTSHRKLMQGVAERWDATIGTVAPGDHRELQSEAQLIAAQWRMALGDRRSAEKSAQQVLEQDTAWRFDRDRAIALALVGEDAKAIDTLRRAFKNGLRGLWWYDVEREPAFARIRADARFKALVQDAQTHAAQQREVLRKMQRDGVAPVRSLPSSAKPMC